MTLLLLPTLSHAQKKPTLDPVLADPKLAPIKAPVWPEAKRQSPATVAAELDRHIEARLAKDKVPASPPADDAEFLRRVHLDLIGRVPTPDRASAFLDSKDPDKRAKLIDELLASPEYGNHFANVWHDLIIPRTPINARIDPEAMRRAFAQGFNDNLPWSEVAAKVARCDDGTAEKNFMAFYRVNGDMGGNPMANVVARSYSRLFLGVRMECAECHDDPFKPWTQDEYWGLAAFFGRVTRHPDREREHFTIAEGTGYKTPKGNNFKLTVNAEGALTIHHEAWTKVGKAIKPAPLGGKALDFRAGQPLLPSFVHWVTAPNNPYLARAAVNRWWFHLFARGLIHPVDDAYEGIDSSHPEVMSLLAEEFTRSRHDLKHLLRILCNSKTYQRTSRPVEGNAKADESLFSRMPLKPMTSEALLASLGVAYDNPDLFPRVGKKGKKGESLEFTRGHFVQLFNTNDVEGDPTDYTHGIPQVLHLMNVPLYNAGGAAVAKLAKKTPEAAVERLYLMTLSRRPTPEEVRRKLDLVAKHKSAAEGLNGILWTLVNQSEFMLNH